MSIIKGKFNKNIILKVAKPLYQSKYHDEKHCWNHIMRIRKDLTKYLQDHTLSELEANVLYTAIIFHDCVMSNKKKHHEKSAEKFFKLVSEKAFLLVHGSFTEEDRMHTQVFLELHMEFIFQCIWEHRSSINAKKKSELGYITSLLDFGYPFPLEVALDKAVRRGIDKVEDENEIDLSRSEKKDSFSEIVHEADKWFRKRWLNFDNPRDITEDDQRKLKESYSVNMIAHKLVDKLYK